MVNAWKYSAAPVGGHRPNGNWICKCGIGNYSHERQCIKCAQPYEEIPDTEEE